MSRIAIWGATAISLLTGLGLNDVLGWFDSGEESVGQTVMYFIIGLLLALVGLLSYIIIKNKR